MGNLILKKWSPPCACPAPRGAHGACDASVFPGRDTPIKKCFHKPEIAAAKKGAQTGAAANILMGEWGQFAPIITSNDFYQVKKIR
jgi:hypothetical protein